MNSKQLFAAAAIALIGSAAMAQETTQAIPTQSTVTRAQVQAELARAIADGSIQRRNDSAYSVNELTASGKSTVTRAEVKADLARAIADGSIERRNESAYSVREISAPVAAGRTREEVRAEAREAARNVKNANSPYSGS